MLTVGFAKPIGHDQLGLVGPEYPPKPSAGKSIGKKEPPTTNGKTSACVPTPFV